MPRDISDSSGDEEATPTKNEARAPNVKRRTRYECPEDFTSTSYVPCRGAGSQSAFDDNKELWLIKAPANFSARSFSGMKLPLAGLKTIQTGKAGASPQIFSVLGGRSTPAGLRLLTCDPQQPDGHLCAPAFSGVLNISESYGDCSSNQGPIAVPAAPAPKLPDGLRQRFFPFGSTRPASAPVTAVPEEATVPLMPVKSEPDATRETPRKRKKEKKKEKRIKEEVGATETAPLAVTSLAAPAAVVVKVELTTESSAEQSTLVDGHVKEERKKKKKKDKEREREKTEEVEDPYVRVKEEPMDTGDHLDSEPAHKKKKKKKKSKTDD